MNEPLSLAFAFFVGILLGAFFFGGLWWTVRQSVASKHPALWFLVSLPLRTSMVVLGFYFILGDDWRKLLAGLLGFIVARLIALRFTRGTEQASRLTQEAAQEAAQDVAQGTGHAP
jgi:F1F0 ATPase subunit 2